MNRHVEYEHHHVAERYHAGRAHVAHVDRWVEVLRPYVDAGARVVEVGAGTGIWPPMFIDLGAASVVAVEPAAAMVAKARDVGPGDRVQLVQARGEELPLRSASVDVAWLSAVYHHLADPVAAAREVRRVVVHGGRMLLRGFFAGTSQLGWLPFFPGHERAAGRFPSVDDVAEAFGRADLRIVDVIAVPEPATPVSDVKAWLVAMRDTDTLLTAFSDDEFAAGIAALDASGAVSLAGALNLLVLA